VRRHRGRHGNGIQRGVGQELLDVVGHPHPRELSGSTVERARRAVAAPDELRPGDVREVAGDVGPPVAESDDADPHRAHTAVEGICPRGFATDEISPWGFAADEISPWGFAADEISPWGFAADLIRDGV
jgi:hypothetical protein